MVGTEMLMKQVFKALGINGDGVVKQIEGIGSSIQSIVNGIVVANRRLARIEAHLGLSDIEPVQTMVLIDAKPNELGASPVGNDRAGS